MNGQVLHKSKVENDFCTCNVGENRIETSSCKNEAGELMASSLEL